MKNRLLLDTLERKKNLVRPPVWLMRQAGRYMPSYQLLRKKHSLMEMFKTPEHIVKTTKLPVDELGVDAAILFSDILLIWQALGFFLAFDQEGLHLETIQNLEDPRLCRPTEEVLGSLEFVFESIKLLKKELDVPLLGFIAAPFTFLDYALDGPKAVSGARSKCLMWKEPLLFKTLLENFSNKLETFAKAQLEAGADLIAIFDSHTHLLSSHEYSTFVFPTIKSLILKLQALGKPVIYYTRLSQLFISELNTLPCALGVDWQTPLLKIIPQTELVIQGNFNPWQLLEPPERFVSLVQEQVELFKDRRNYICSLGHGVLPNTPQEHVKAWVQAAQSTRWTTDESSD